MPVYAVLSSSSVPLTMYHVLTMYIEETLCDTQVLLL